MSRKRLALAAAAVSGLLALGACGGSDDGPAEPSPPVTTAPATTGPETTTEETTTEQTTTDETPGPEPVVVTIENGRPVGGVKTVEVTQGDMVVIRVMVDTPQELHLHGYEIEREAAPDMPAVFRFTADLEGIFDLESHEGDAKVVKLVVNP
jgi:hypothetical protein